jgi:arabinofuranan 3-O-arabinosyltransferase
VIAIAGRFVPTSIHTTVGALLSGEPINAVPCQGEPIALPAGKQELLISPGDAFVVEGAELAAPAASPISSPSAPTTTARVGTWGPDRREIHTDPAPTERVLVVPESVNPGWIAQSPNGTRLTPIVVNGWQQGWVVPAGTAGTITLTFPSNAPYRAGLGWGLALLPVLALLALARPRRRADDAPARPWRVPPIAGAVAALASGWLISGFVGVVVLAAALGVRYLVSARRADAITVGTTATAFIMAGAVLSRHPWRSVDGYGGHSWGVQLLALIAIGALAASVTALSNGGALRRYSQRRNATRHGDSTSA